jgi:hypothetical protein
MNGDNPPAAGLGALLALTALFLVVFVVKGC